MVEMLNEYHGEFQAVLDHLKQEVSALRTGRATPSIVENVQVEAYGSRTALVGLASISCPEPRSIVVEPWDKSIVKDIERGIIEAKLGLNPVVQGSIIRVPLPALTEESRRELIKVMNEKLENARISVRNVREKAKSAIQATEKAKEISEDEKYKLLEQLDKTSAGWNEKIKHVGEEKEKEIMTV